MTYADDAPRVTVRNPVDLIAAVPYALGFHPDESLVALGVDHGRLVFAARVDLAEADAPDVEYAERAHQLIYVVARQGVRAASVLGYGPADRVDRAMAAVRTAIAGCRLPAYELLRITGNRFWSYLCSDRTCCPPEGRVFDVAESPVTAGLASAGERVLPSRDALAGTVAPVSGEEREAMRAATRRAEARLVELIRPAPTSTAVHRMMRQEGAHTLRQALRRHRAGGRLNDDEVAWLTLMLTVSAVRDRAWRHLGDPDGYVPLWLDVTRRAEPDLVAAPACLLAGAAWRSGQGAIASVAVERALAAEPGYALALLMDDLLRDGLPPSTVEGWQHP